MARPESYETIIARMYWSFDKRFETVLAAPWEPGTYAEQHYDKLDAIGRAVNDAGRSICLMHKEFSVNWPDKKVYDVASRIVIPTSDLVLLYGLADSDDMGMMYENAVRHGIPTLALVPRLDEKWHTPPSDYAIAFDGSASRCRDLTTMVYAFFTGLEGRIQQAPGSVSYLQ